MPQGTSTGHGTALHGDTWAASVQTVVALVSQQEWLAHLEDCSNTPIVLAPLYLPLSWLVQCKVRALFLSIKLHSAVWTHLHLEVLKKSDCWGLRPYINFDLQFLICGVLFILESGKAFKH